MKKIRKGDEVIVITGKDKGKKGKVLAMLDGGQKVLVEGINIVKKCVKPNPNAGVQGGIIPKEMPMQSSNIMLLDPATGKGSKVGIRKNADGLSERFYKASGQLVEAVKG